MQITHSDLLEGDQPHCSIGHIRATSSWRPASDPVGEADRLEAIAALVREAQEYGADAIVSVVFEVTSVKRDQIDGVPLRCVVARGVAVQFSVSVSPRNSTRLQNDEPHLARRPPMPSYEGRASMRPSASLSALRQIGRSSASKLVPYRV
jgi:Putative heavy-metal-binding